MTRLVDVEVSADMLTRARAGDECAQSGIYSAVAPATFALIRRLVGNRTLAEDLFQDTMMSVYQSLSTFRGEAPLGAWVKQIAVRRRQHRGHERSEPGSGGETRGGAREARAGRP
jgi:RNA polymerase sigma-70 factor (ECF subfamily)